MWLIWNDWVNVLGTQMKNVSKYRNIQSKQTFLPIPTDVELSNRLLLSLHSYNSFFRLSFLINSWYLISMSTMLNIRGCFWIFQKTHFSYQGSPCLGILRKLTAMLFVSPALCFRSLICQVCPHLWNQKRKGKIGKWLHCCNCKMRPKNLWFESQHFLGLLK